MASCQGYARCSGPGLKCHSSLDSARLHRACSHAPCNFIVLPEYQAEQLESTDPEDQNPICPMSLSLSRRVTQGMESLCLHGSVPCPAHLQGSQPAPYSSLLALPAAHLVVTAEHLCRFKGVEIGPVVIPTGLSALLIGPAVPCCVLPGHVVCMHFHTWVQLIPSVHISQKVEMGDHIHGEASQGFIPVDASLLPLQRKCRADNLIPLLDMTPRASNGPHCPQGSLRDTEQNKCVQGQVCHMGLPKVISPKTLPDS